MQASVTFFLCFLHNFLLHGHLSYAAEVLFVKHDIIMPFLVESVRTTFRSLLGAQDYSHVYQKRVLQYTVQLKYKPLTKCHFFRPSSDFPGLLQELGTSEC